MTLGELILARRAACGLSQRSLAIQLRLDYSYLCRIEKGERFPSLKYIPRLAVWLGITEAELLSILGKQRVCNQLSKLESRPRTVWKEDLNQSIQDWHTEAR